MQTDAETAFRRYLAAIPDDLLVEVLEDFAWLAEEFAAEPPAEDYRHRRELSAAEMSRRCGHAA
jgi:hypothetical protein